MLTCKEAEKLVMPYINDQLDGRELEAFLNHIQNCPSCREELEIYYIVSSGLKQLDSGSGGYDIAGELENGLYAAWMRVRAARLVKVICYAVNTLAVTGVLTALPLQIRIWAQSGIW